MDAARRSGRMRAGASARGDDLPNRFAGLISIPTPRVVPAGGGITAKVAKLIG